MVRSAIDTILGKYTQLYLVVQVKDYAYGGAYKLGNTPCCSVTHTGAFSYP